ncbi:MAG TPA: hypothetical protein VIV60_34520, partial [Polyangiaceae bacterium]
KYGAEAEHRRLLAEVGRTGTLKCAIEPALPEAPRHSFEDTAKRFRAAHMQTALKPTTRNRYDRIFDRLLVRRLGSKPLVSRVRRTPRQRSARTALDGH